MNQVKDYFNSDPYGYSNKYESLTAEGYAFRVRKYSLLKTLGNGNGNLLDLGCGPAVMTEDIIAQGWVYHGVDIAPKMIELAKNKFTGKSANFKIGSVNKIDYLDNYFDVIVAMGLVEYLDDEKRALKEMARVLKPGGRLIVSIPNWWSPARMWDRWLLTPLSRAFRFLTRRGRSNKLFHREYKVSEYKKFLEQNGFKNLSWKSYNFRITPRPFDYWFPKLAIWTSKLLENNQNRLWWIGTSINVEARKN